jgi:hypothetical protein
MTLGALAGSSAWLPRSGGEIPQQPGKSFLVRIVIVPMGEIANMPRPFNRSHPSLVRILNGLVDLNAHLSPQSKALEAS